MKVCEVFNGEVCTKGSAPFRMPRALHYLGEALRIEYLSNKHAGGGNGKPAIYFHDFSKNVHLFADEKGKGQLYILGNSIKIREPGIIG